MSSAVSATAAVSASQSSLASSSVGGSGIANTGAAPAAATTEAFGVSVSIDISIAASTQTTSSSTTQDGTQVLATLQQSQESVRDHNKKDAAAKLDEAVKELSLLKLLGNTIAGAREAVKLAKQIAAAVKEYADAGGTPAASAISVAGTGLTQADAVTSAQRDPFYAIAGAALSSLQKFLKKTLPSLLNSTDPAVRAEARRLAREFHKAESSIDGTDTSTNQNAASTAATIGNLSAATVAVAASASISVNLRA